MKNTSHRKITSYTTLKSSTNTLSNTATNTIPHHMMKRNKLKSAIITTPKEGQSYTNTTVYLNTMESTYNNTSCSNNSIPTQAPRAKDNHKTNVRKPSQCIKINLQSNPDKPNRTNTTIQNKPTANRTSSTQLNSFYHKNNRYNSKSYTSTFLNNFVSNSEHRKDDNNETQDRNITMTSYENKTSDHDTSWERKIEISDNGTKGKDKEKVSENITLPIISPGSFRFPSTDATKFIRMFDKIKCVINDSLKPELENLILIFQEQSGKSNCGIINEKKNKIKFDQTSGVNKLFLEIDTLENEIHAMNKPYTIDSSLFSKKYSSVNPSPKKFSNVDNNLHTICSDTIQFSSENRISIYNKCFRTCTEAIKEITEKVKSSDLTTISTTSNSNTDILNSNITNNIAAPVNKKLSVNFNVNVNLNTIITEKENVQNNLTRKLSKQKQTKSKKIFDKDDDDYGVGPIHEGVYANIPIAKNIHVNKPKEANMPFRVFTDGDAQSCEENQNNTSWILGPIDSVQDEKIENEASNKKNTFKKLRSKSLLEIKIKKISLKPASQVKHCVRLFVEDKLISDSEEDSDNESVFDGRICSDDKKKNSPGIIQLHEIPIESSNVAKDSAQLHSSRLNSEGGSLKNCDTQRTIPVQFERIPKDVRFTTGKFDCDGNWEGGFPGSPKAILVKMPSKKKKEVPSETSKEQNCIVY